MGNYAVLTKADRDLLKENGIAADCLVVAHRGDATTCFLNHKTRDNILLGGEMGADYETVHAKRKTNQILLRDGIDCKAVDVTAQGDRSISMVHKTTKRTIYLARGDRKW